MTDSPRKTLAELRMQGPPMSTEWDTHAAGWHAALDAVEPLFATDPAPETKHRHDWVRKEHLPGGFNRYHCTSCGAEEVEPAAVSDADRVDPEWIKAQRDQGWPDMHPEDYCHRCGARNDINWCASAEDWQTATAAWAAETGREGICCVPCFIQMHREATGRDVTWVPTPWRGSWDLHAAHPAPAWVTTPTGQDKDGRPTGLRIAPVSDARREDVEAVERAIRQSFESDDHAHTYRRAALAVRAVLPAPPVVDEDEDGLTPLEQAIAKRLYERWADDNGELTIRTDPRDVALHLRAVLPAPPVVDEAEVRERIAQDIEAAARANLALGLYEAIDIVRGATRG